MPFSLISSTSGSGLAIKWLVLLFLGVAWCGWGGTIQVTNTADSGLGSFRQAILTSYTNPGPNTIVFQISGTPPFTIIPLSALPALTAPVVIDATTQPGFAGKPVVELDGASTSAGTVGLRFSAGASTLRGLAVNRFPGQALELDSPSNTIQGNFIGTDVTGMIRRDNGLYGILVKSAGNLIGGTNAGNGNLISAGLSANSAGIYVLSATNNIVQGNLIGVNATGTGAFSSTNDGIILYGSGANLIGGPVAAARNIISGNGLSGIYLIGATATGNVIQGNYIGTDISGSNAVGNASEDGITLVSAPGNVICSNLISGNALAGVSIQSAGGNQVLGNFIGTDVNGKVALTNHNAGVSISGGGANQIGGTNAGAGNVISGNAQGGIYLTGGTGTNLIQGNLIGLTAAGTSVLGNFQDGIEISGGTGNIIGGGLAGARNVISGNLDNGVDIVQVTDSGNLVQGNYIGTDVTGSQPIGNKLAGILIEGCSNCVGGTVAGAGNVISGNTQQGISLVGNNGNVKGNVIQGNLIGLNAVGTAGLANGVSSAQSAGIGISSASANLVGGTVAGAGNVISANNGWGVFVFGNTVSGNTASGNTIQGNFIGTDPTGTVRLGNAFAGLYLVQAATNQIGGSGTGAGNVISANTQQGIFLTNASWNVIQGNFIGTKADGTNNLGNELHGIDLQANANHNVIGGTAAGAGNHLAWASVGYSGVYCGVRVRTGAVNDLISGNSIFSNGALGIDLSPTTGGTAAGVNPIVTCESGVAPNAANAGQNFPTLSNVYSGAITLISGNLNSASGNSYTLQFFASPVGSSSGYGQGQVYLGQTNLTLGNASCSSNFTVCLPVSVPAGWVVTATATSSTDDTSEFSAWVRVFPVPTVKLSAPNRKQVAISWTNNGGSFALLQATNLTPPVVWLTVTNLPVLVSNFMVTTLGATNKTVFYRLAPQ
jgi:parallel beta-helix repeat protein